MVDKVEKQINEKLKSQTELNTRSIQRMKERALKAKNKETRHTQRLAVQEVPCSEDFLQRMVVNYKQVLIR